MIFQLLYVPAFLSRLKSFCPGIHKHPDILRTGNHSVEVVGPDSILIFIRRKSESLPEFRRYERRTDTPSWEDSFIGRHYHQITEIQGTSLQRSHNLKSFKRLSSERDRHISKKLVQQTYICRWQYLQSYLPDETDTPVIFLCILQFKRQG